MGTRGRDKTEARRDGNEGGGTRLRLGGMGTRGEGQDRG